MPGNTQKASATLELLREPQRAGSSCSWQPCFSCDLLGWASRGLSCCLSRSVLVDDASSRTRNPQRVSFLDRCFQLCIHQINSGNVIYDGP